MLLSRQRGAVVWSVVFTTMIARLMVQLPTSSRCCVLAMIISAWWNPASSELKKSKENSTGKLESKGNS